jgi:hypothetical protein
MVQGMNEQFHVRREFSGMVKIVCPPLMIVPPMVAMEMAKAILHEAGVEVVVADPGQTVIRPPKNGNGMLK